MATDIAALTTPIDINKAIHKYQVYVECQQRRSKWMKETEEGREYNRVKARRHYAAHSEEICAKVRERAARRRQRSPEPAGAPAEPEPPAGPPAPEPAPAQPPPPEPAPPAPEPPAPALRSVTPGRMVTFMDRPVNLYMGRASTPVRAQTPMRILGMK